MTTAHDIAAELGRDWNDCGAYERMSFEDEAARRKEPTRTENERIAVAYSAIDALWGDRMSWEQIETLARQVVRALDSKSTTTT